LTTYGGGGVEYIMMGNSEKIKFKKGDFYEK